MRTRIFGCFMCDWNDDDSHSITWRVLVSLDEALFASGSLPIHPDKLRRGYKNTDCAKIHVTDPGSLGLVSSAMLRYYLVEYLAVYFRQKLRQFSLYCLLYIECSGCINLHAL